MRIASLIPLFLLISSVLYAQDLVFESYSGGDLQIERYAEFTQTVVIKNTGIVEVDEPFSSQIFLSVDPVLGSGDISIAYKRCFTVINAGSTVNLSFHGESVDVGAGVYYMILQLDYAHEVQETDDLNNFVIGKVEMLPPTLDWEIKSLGIDSTNAQYWYDFYPDDLYDPYYNPYFPRDTIFHQDEELWPVLNIVNNGATPISGYLWLTFFLSTDAVLDGNDMQIATDYVWLDGAMNFTLNYHSFYPYYPWNFIIPAQTSPGTYHLIAKVDSEEPYGGPNGEYIEANEQNNVAVSNSIVIGPAKIDLAVESAEATYSDKYLYGSFWLRNLGETGTSSYSTMAFLSLDQQIDNEDYLFVGDYVVSNYERQPFIAKGGWQNGSMFGIARYEDPKPGMYYLILTVSGAEEKDYSNNIYVSETANVQVGSGIYTPHLSITGATIPGSFNDLQRNFPLNISFKNNEDSYFGTWVNFEISILAADNSTMKNWTVSEYISISENSTQSYTWDLEVDNPLALGTYTVQITPKTSLISPAVTTSLVIDIPSYEISGVVAGENNGGAINKGKLFLYHKPSSGKVRFINKTIFEDSNVFSYEVAGYPHTLFYIPDPIAYPDYVPTILGKTVTLQESNFFTLTHDVDTVFEILHTQPISSGGRAVTGNVYTSSASGRIAELTEESTEGFPVVLLSSDGTPIRVTTTDAQGSYSFTGLPEDVYQVIVALELDQTTMDEPVQADVTEHDVVLNLQIGDTEVTPEVKFGQQISFEEVNAKVFGDEAFDIAAESSSGLTVSISSSNPDVAIIVDGKIEIVGAGSTTITLTQEGNEEYVAAETVSYEMMVAKADPVISFTIPEDKNLDDGSFELSASSTSPVSITFMSDNEAIATVEGTTVTMLSPGEVNITALQEGNDNFNSSSATQLLRVNVVTGIAESLRSIKLTPNPVVDFMKIETEEEIVGLELFDTIGKPVTVSFTGNVADLRGIASGVYVVKVVTSRHRSIARIVKH